MPLALYRKYRPKKLSDLLGQETNVEIIRNAARQDRIGHAYLVYGARGTGKTTTARLIAKLANCQKRATNQKFRETGEPCNECASCLAIDTGTSLDVVEIDAASNRGIDEIRNLKENIAVAPSQSPYRIYIIDEAHMLTGAAFNALLKTLEEPPRHAIFVLATTEYEKLPATITSRTQRFLFKKQPKAVIFEKLTSVAKSEKIAIDDDALELIAAAAEGSFRDAESLLEQMSSMEDQVTLASVERITGRTGLKKVATVANLLLSGKKTEALKALAELHEEGHNAVQFVKDLIRYLRNVLTLAVHAEAEDFLKNEATADELKELKRLAGIAAPEKQTALIRALIKAYSEMQYSPFAMIPLEVAIIESLP